MILKRLTCLRISLLAYPKTTISPHLTGNFDISNFSPLSTYIFKFSLERANSFDSVHVSTVDKVSLMDELSCGWNGIPPFFNCIFIVRFSVRKQKTNFNNFTYTKNNMHVEKCWTQYLIVSHNNQNKQCHKIKDNR